MIIDLDARVQHGGKKIRSCNCVNSLVSFGFRGASLERRLPKLRGKGYSCQCITHFGCLWSENREKTFKFVITFHQQATDRLPTSYRHITNCRPTVGGLSADCRPTGSLYFGQNLLAVCRPTVGQQSADCWSTHGRLSVDRRPTVNRQVFWGGLLHNYRNI